MSTIADFVVIVDTGSTDDTLDIAQSLLKEIPGELHSQPWVDFGHNRTELLDLSRGKARWLLMLDADYTVAGEVDVDQLGSADAYLIAHRTRIEYRTPRLVRGDMAWRYVGVVHEYLDTADGRPYRREPLDSLWIVDHGDGGHRHRDRRATLNRDRDLLRRQVTQTPDDARAWFYLGRTLVDLGQQEAAISAFERRIALGGWAEEVYYATYQLGLCQQQLGRTGEAVRTWLLAWDRRPHRLEALHAAVRQLRIDGAYRSALALLDAVGPQPAEPDILFVDTSVARHGLPLERSICSYYVHGPQQCLDLTTALLQDPDVPSDVAAFAHQNAELCRNRLGNTTTNSAAAPLATARPRLARV